MNPQPAIPVLKCLIRLSTVNAETGAINSGYCGTAAASAIGLPHRKKSSAASSGGRSCTCTDTTFLFRQNEIQLQLALL